MADFETKLRWLSERGEPVGAEELIERIEADLAGDPLVVVAKRREGTVMTKTQQPPTTTPRKRYRGPALALAIFVAVLAVPAVYFAFSGDEEPVADTQPTLTTVAPEVETMTDLEVIEAGVAALYSGDAERAAELFELPGRTDDEIRQEAAYQAAIGGNLTLNCRELDTPGEFRCTTPYHNTLTDAIGYVDSPGDSSDVLVEDGVIREFAFPEHSFIVVQMGTFLAMEGRLEGYEDCASGPFAESCATIQLENLDAWAEWRENVEAADVVDAALDSWFGGDCQAALFISGDQFWDDTPIDCATESTLTQTIEYESILAADVSLRGCEETPIADDEVIMSCDVHYSNAMNTAVGQQPTVTTKEFTVLFFGVVRQPGSDRPWHQDAYPENTELLQSFREFAEGGELQEAYAEARCASERTPNCANLIVDNLDDWAVWYDTNS